MDLATGISLLHAVYVAWFLYAPFSNDLLMMAVHAVIAPAMMLHWLMNDDTCVLTAIEAAARGVDPKQTFIGRVVSPIYLLPSGSNFTMLWYAFTILLWLRSIWGIRHIMKTHHARQHQTVGTVCSTCQGK